MNGMEEEPDKKKTETKSFLAKNFSLFTSAMQMKFDSSATADNHKKA